MSTLRAIWVMRRSKVLVVAFILVTAPVALANIAPKPAYAYYQGTAGYTTCPHGYYNTSQWASNICYYGSVASRAYATFSGGPNVLANDQFQKVSLYGGSPCNGFYEGGIEWYPYNSQGAVEGVPYQQWRSPNGAFHLSTLPNAPFPSSVGIVWVGGSSQNFNLFINRTYINTAGPIGSGGCVAEAGVYVYGPMTTPNASTSAHAFTVNLVDGTIVTSTGLYETDDPCSLYPAPCMNGVFIDSNDGWAASENS
jgi:hypothetical protein